MSKKKSILLSFLLFFSYLFCTCAVAWIEGPFVNNITSDSVVIWWNSSSLVSGRVFVGDKVIEKRSFPFEIKITGLKPDTTYNYYVVFSNGERRPKKGYYTFHTAFKGTRSFKFAVFGDSRGPFSLIPVNEEVLKKILCQVKEKDVEFICFLGDLVYGKSRKEKQLRDEFRIWKDIASFVMHEIAVYTIMGNHDTVMHKTAQGYLLDGEKREKDIIYSEKIFADEFVNPENSPAPETPVSPSYKENVYSFDWGNSHFVVINTDYWIAFPKRELLGESKKIRFYGRGNLPGMIMRNQLKWIEEDIKKARASGARHIFVFGHQPIFPVTDEHAIDYSPNATKEVKECVRKMRKKLWDIFEKYDVDAAFFGHEHNYSRLLVNKTWQIITGGAGAPLYDKNDKVHYPWLKGLKKFKKCYHYCIVTVNKDKVRLDVFGMIKGKFQLIDHADL